MDWMDIQYFAYSSGMARRAFERLNPRQREAATFGNGPLLILAGAGTGKTNTLAHRVAHLVLRGREPASGSCCSRLRGARRRR